MLEKTAAGAAFRHRPDASRIAYVVLIFRSIRADMELNWARTASTLLPVSMRAFLLPRGPGTDLGTSVRGATHPQIRLQISLKLASHSNKLQNCHPRPSLQRVWDTIQVIGSRIRTSIWTGSGLGCVRCGRTPCGDLAKRPRGCHTLSRIESCRAVCSPCNLRKRGRSGTPKPRSRLQ